MKNPKILIRNFFTSLVVVLQIVAFPLSAFAEDVAPSSTDPASTTPTPKSQPVEPAPVSTPAPVPVVEDPYVLNPETGNYENSKYSWSPDTFQSSPKTAPDYSFNTETNTWETPQHAYDDETEEYKPNLPLATDLSSTQQLSPNNGLLGNDVEKTGLLPSSYDGDFNGIPDSPDQSHFFSGFYNGEISNNIYSTARSGDALVAQNTLGGNALSGDARAIANLFNLLQSSFNPNGGSIGTFVANIDGNVVGDIKIDPSSIPTKQINVVDGADSDLKINVENNGTITNNIDLDASSGNAGVTGNTEAGDATSGDATALANVVNMINSTVSAGDSFFGIININGNFNGDILMPPNALDYLLASSVPKTTVDLTKLGDNSMEANMTNNQKVENNINTIAESGSATVSKNTMAGSATSGDAQTSVTIMNLTGSNIIGANSLLVFVNVMGEWVGLIVDAPAGSKSAAYAGGVSNNSLMPYSDAEVNATNNSTITNNINVAARSGDADVSSNTIAGDATSGDAKAGVNVLNIMNSNLAFSDWFGVLFINVFGTWNGSFGVDTAAGTLPGSSNKPGSKKPATPRMIAFVPSDTSAANGSNTSNDSYNMPVYPASFFGDVDITDSDKDKVVLASANKSSIPPADETIASATQDGGGFINWGIAVASLTILALALGAERLITGRRATDAVLETARVK